MIAVVDATGILVRSFGDGGVEIEAGVRSNRNESETMNVELPFTTTLKV